MAEQGQSRKLPGRLRGEAAWLPWDWQAESNVAGAVAIQAVADGVATPEQQQLAIQTIVEGIADYHGISYSPDSQYDTAFAEGKRFVGAQIAKLARLNYGRIRRAISG